jgi:hypothetical protein
LLVPVPANFLGGLLVAKADFFKERRTASDDAAPLAADLANPAVAALGGVYLPHAAEGAPRFFALAARYDRLSVKGSQRPMSEYILGADVDDDDTPFELRFDPSDESESRFFVRYRQFPGHHRWLVVAGHKLKRRSGFNFDVAVPTHALVGWESLGGAWAVYGGGRVVGREYPVAFDGAVAAGDDDVHGWIEGYATLALLGVRAAIAAPLYVALEAGAQRETLTFYDEKGETLDAYSTAFAPWARLALETYLR